MKKAFYFLAVALLVSLVCNYAQCTGNDARTDTVTVERTDTLYVTKKDTVPVVSKEMVVSYVNVPIPIENTYLDNIRENKHDSVCLPVTQKMYTDDSTYTAYVSGIRYQELPKLDSIAVRQRTIYREIERTISVNQRRFSIGLQTGVGVGIIHRQPDIYIGFGIQWKITK